MGSTLLFLTYAVFATIAYALFVCIGRVYFHAFAHVPGPILAKLTNAYSAYHAAKGDTHVMIQRLHEQYGPVVRYGPDRILFNSRKSMEEIYGRHENLFKGRAYDAMRVQPLPSVFNAASNELHSRRRKIISQGFSEQAMRASESKILRHVGNYCDVLFEPSNGKDWGEARETTQWSAFFAIDLIADLTVGRSTAMLTSPDNRVYNPARKANFVRMGLAIQWPEAFCSGMVNPIKVGEVLFPKIAKLGKEWHMLLGSWIASRLTELRSEKATGESDMITAIAQYRDPDSGEGLSDGELTAEMTTLLIAGSGTITTGMTSLLWYLSRYPDEYQKAVQEVRSIFKKPQDIGMNSRLSRCTYLKACLQEAMRVSPAPTAPLYREAGPGGASVCGIYVPEGYEVATSIYALHHNEAHHPDSFRFDPSRWLQDNEKVAATKAAWAPFSVGDRNCVGMTLATNEVLITMVTILWHGDFRIADDAKLASIGAGSSRLGPGRQREKEFQLYDTFGASTDGPYLQFKRRETI
ncbi:fatty acid synthase alpha subunit reductase [Paraphaeosphaeria sporulosa]